MLRILTALAMIGVTSSALASSASTTAEPGLPNRMVWTAYDLGSSGYAEAVGIANAFRKRFDTRVRVMPSITSIGRMLPLVTGKASYGFLANEAYFAAEGTYDFASLQWGPQDIRIVLGKPTSIAIAIAADTGVKTVYDLKGKRLGYVKGNPSVNIKHDAYLAFAGLTRDDIEVVWFGSNGAIPRAVLANQIDGFSSVTTSANMHEIQASPRGLTYAEMPPDDKKAWERLHEVVDFMAPYRETRGVGLSEENPANIAQIRYPMITVYPQVVGADQAYQFVKAADLAFDDYKNTTATGAFWAIEKAGRPPADAPMHEGTIRYMKEKGLWREQDQAWQEHRLARLDQVLEAWNKAQADFHEWRAAEQAKGNAVDPEEAWGSYWDAYRAEHL